MGRVLRKVLMRWDGVVVLLLLVLPVLATSILGFIWLGERGLLLTFVAVVTGVGLLYGAVRFALRWWVRRDATVLPTPDIPHVEPEADWSDLERSAFNVACKLIRNDASRAAWAEIIARQSV